MRLEIQNEPLSEILVEDLPSDALAVITAWPMSCFVGQIIQLSGVERVCIVGKIDWFHISTLSKHHRCRVLPPGTLLKIV